MVAEKIALLVVASLASGSALRLSGYGASRIGETGECKGESIVLDELRPPSGKTPRAAAVCLNDANDNAISSSMNFKNVLNRPHVNYRQLMDKTLWVLITGAAENDGENFKNRVVSSAETWLSSAADNTIISVFADSNQTRKVLSEARCQELVQVDIGSQRFFETQCPTKGKPVFALIVPCASDEGHDGQYEQGACCKYDNALSYIDTHIARQSLPSPDWVWIGDDDMYARTPELMKLISMHEAKTEAIMLNADGDLSRESPNIRKWNEQINACNEGVPQGFFYSMISAGLRTKLVDDIAKGHGLAKTCGASGGAYDTTAGLWGWKHGAKFLPTARYTEVSSVISDGTNLTEAAESKIFFHGIRSESDYHLLHGAVEHTASSLRKFSQTLQQVPRSYGWFDRCASLLGD